MTDATISVMLIAGFGDESHYYHCESWSFYFCIEVSCQEGSGSIKSFILAHSSLISI